VDGGGTVFRGLVYMKDEPLSKKKADAALREAGGDVAHNVFPQAAFVWTDHADEKEGRGWPIITSNNAYWDGVNVIDNPYTDETEERRSWEEGGRAAREQDYDESEG
jgi:hypothetical protein